ncbi:hypothetical protein [Sphingomonas gellani]|uniref:hypothetical protein n=1 Tax=Sphingomonas gellani TaxID=1166340 RepID=UPI00147D463E|nr:hypothetical protein [Sphingomonas gellani]
MPDDRETLIVMICEAASDPQALDALIGTLVRPVRSDGGWLWQADGSEITHPTIGWFRS